MTSHLLATDPSLADLFASMIPGKVAAKTVQQNPGQKVVGTPQPFVGPEFPTYFKRADGKPLRPLPLDANLDRKPLWSVLAKHM